MSDCQWFKLAGESESAVKEILALSQAGEEPLNPEEHKDLFEKIGFFHGSVRKAPQGHAYMLYPDVFATEDGLYLAAPLGISANDIRNKRHTLSHFTPPGATALSDAETAQLANRLFPAWGASVPIIYREPLFSPQAPAPAPAR